MLNQWIIFLKIWRIVLNEIILSSACQPVVCACGCLAAHEPFYHIDRIPDFNDLVYVAEGTMYVSEGGTDYEIHAGELLFLKHHVRHCGVKEIQPGTAWYYAHFYLDEPVDAAAVYASDKAMQQCEVLPKKLSGLKNSDIEQRFSELVKYCRLRDGVEKMRINNMFGALLIDIALMKYANDRKHTLSFRICKWLDKHYNEPFSASRLEKKFFLSYKRMAAVFKEEQGMTMQQYHTERRMMIACDLLKATPLPVNEIAADLGYDDPLYFSRCFHAKYGLSPRSYRILARTDY